MLSLIGVLAVSYLTGVFILWFGFLMTADARGRGDDALVYATVSAICWPWNVYRYLRDNVFGHLRKDDP